MHRKTAARRDISSDVSHDAVRAFLGELIDDAGLFPPARLSMADALSAHALAAAGESYWIAGRFVVPASRVAELARILDDAPRALSTTVVLDGPVADAAAFASLADDERAARDRITVDSVELPLAKLPGETDDARCAALQFAMANAGFLSIPTAYVEVNLAEEFVDDGLLAVHRARERGIAICAKIRCGGLDAGAVPAASAVARFLWTAHRFGVPFKATAGLHEAVRHNDARLGADVFGFLNVIGAAVLSSARALDVATLERVLLERDARAFGLDARRFSWRDIGADTSEVGEARAAFVHSYGSCSFDEPVADLRALGLLASATVSR